MRSTAPTPRAPARARFTLRVLQTGAILVVLAALPYKQFDLDRFFVPKELVLHATALLVSLALLVSASRLSLARVDQFLAGFLGVGILSAIFATNWWLAERAAAVSLSGAACFWAARAVGRAGLGRRLVGVLAFAAVLGAITALLQAYGVRTEYVSLNRAPGGTFGNRNFMAHLGVIAAPALVLVALTAPTRASFMRWSGGIALVAAALFLSRSRAAWLALIACGVLALPLGIVALRGAGAGLRWSRALLLVVAAAAGIGVALALPNTLDWNSESPYLDTAKSVVNYKGGSGHGRLVQYGNTLRMSSHHPLLGVGPGNWAVVYPKFASRDDPSLASDGMTANPWPSSDWMTFLSERGLVAFVLLGFALVSLVADGLRGLSADRAPADRLVAATLLGTIVVLLVVGSFDAVLLLPVNALIAWSLLGALSPEGRERAVVELPAVRRIGATLLLLAIGAVAVARSATQASAMEVFSSSSRATVLEAASRFDPGSYRIHVRLAAAWIRRGNCTRAKPHARAAKALFPNAAEPKVLLSQCGAR
ncbi:MAG: O-antigen ligase family protein [Gemmatimonadaceae bacterium]